MKLGITVEADYSMPFLRFVGGDHGTTTDLVEVVFVSGIVIPRRQTLANDTLGLVCIQPKDEAR